MAKNNNQPNNTIQGLNNNKRRAENKDNLDSRKNEEWLTMGPNVTHNEKPTKQSRLKKKND